MPVLAGVILAAKTLERMIMRAEIRELDTIFSVSTTCGNRARGRSSAGILLKLTSVAALCCLG
jgi:hypothetical protein